MRRERRITAAALATALLIVAGGPGRPLATGGRVAVDAVATVGATVSDLARSTRFFVEVLGFEIEGGPRTELTGRPFELLHGLFGARAQVATLKLGRERIELTEYLAPRGRPYPVDTRGNDRWFQHIAIITSDMERAYARLREYGVAHASTGPQRLPKWNTGAADIQAFYFRDPDGHFLEVL
jgi:catechol 2,3-dioxygenase-like lactoylglutathione lyase family enzyme